MKRRGEEAGETGETIDFQDSDYLSLICFIQRTCTLQGVPCSLFEKELGSTIGIDRCTIYDSWDWRIHLKSQIPLDSSPPISRSCCLYSVLVEPVRWGNMDFLHGANSSGRGFPIAAHAAIHGCMVCSCCSCSRCDASSWVGDPGQLGFFADAIDSANTCHDAMSDPQ